MASATSVFAIRPIGPLSAVALALAAAGRAGRPSGIYARFAAGAPRGAAVRGACDRWLHLSGASRRHGGVPSSRARGDAVRRRRRTDRAGVPSRRRGGSDMPFWISTTSSAIPISGGEAEEGHRCPGRAHPVVLMHYHGATVVGAGLRELVSRSVFMRQNATISCARSRSARRNRCIPARSSLRVHSMPCPTWSTGPGNIGACGWKQRAACRHGARPPKRRAARCRNRHASRRANGARAGGADAPPAVSSGLLR